jgi:aerobic-type carbon monoxide dehydrogenase small subunit (CoxS/CutS family)
VTAGTDLRLLVNGTWHEVRAFPDDTLLDVLRRELGLFSCRETCGIGLCGACTVMSDGKAVSACLALALACADQEITTAEGLVQAGQLHPVQQAFLDAQAFQCSFCTPGFVLSLVAMLGEPAGQRDPEAALSGHLCRCGSYGQIAVAVSQIVRDHEMEKDG